MNPDLAHAVAVLERRGTLYVRAGAALRARGAPRARSLHTELRLLAYAGVLSTMAGVGVLVRRTSTASARWRSPRRWPGARSSVCCGWPAGPGLHLGRGASPHLALDYVLLLGALLVGADLAYVEARFTPLGGAWPWHLLIVAVLYGLLAFRYDSRVLLSLALTTFAAWRGVTTTLLNPLSTFGDDLVRANAAACGILFLALGAVRCGSRGWKPHFEPVATHLGWLLLLGAGASALDTPAGSVWALPSSSWRRPAVLGYRQRRFSLLALGIVAAYAGVSALVLRASHGADRDLVVRRRARRWSWRC